jgi:hypothetical protein
MKDVILREAQKGVRNMRLKSGLRAGGGLLGILAGIPLVSSVFAPKEQPSWQNTFNQMLNKR